MSYELMGWWLMAAVAVFCAIGMLSSRNAVHSALWLVANFVALAVIYLLLSAPVLFAIQMIVYAGAIMVLFLFVIMFFMSPKLRRWLRPPLKGQLVVGGLLVLAFMVLLLWGAFGSGFGTAIGEPSGARESLMAAAAADAAGVGDPRPLGIWLFKYHVLPFELVSVLLLIAMIGALMVARDVRSEGRDRLPDTAAIVPDDESAGGEVQA